jgi:hypothetical protein
MVAVVGAACGGRQPIARPSSPPSISPTAATALPSDGWRPGDIAMSALTGGRFHAAVVRGTVCAWLGDSFRPMLWPAGYRVRLRPVELIAPSGAVVAREGQRTGAGGGSFPATAGTPCARAGQETFAINGELE